MNDHFPFATANGTAVSGVATATTVNRARGEDMTCPYIMGVVEQKAKRIISTVG